NSTHSASEKGDSFGHEQSSYNDKVHRKFEILTELYVACSSVIGIRLQLLEEGGVQSVVRNDTQSPITIGETRLNRRISSR
ncbi:hypothetical protein RA269_28825, partial [Pseudomonas syringae pv. tagetis]|uniref:hypothetical protein n=1 Tax=Pseudomonas syringae group genomosp. 7 TaxID=251699 RepID=UPI00376F9F9A